LSTKACNHPGTAYTERDFRDLTGYHLIEVVNGPFRFEDVWDAAAGDADRLHGRLGPVLAVVLFEQPGRPEDVIGESDEQLADFGRSIDRREREPPDLGVLRVPRDA